MPVNPLLLNLFVDTISIEPFEGYVGGGVRKFGGPVLFAPGTSRGGVKVTKEEKLLIIPGSEPRMSGARVTFPQTESIDSRSRINIPSIGVTKQDIASVQQHSGPIFSGGPNHHTVVMV